MYIVCSFLFTASLLAYNEGQPFNTAKRKRSNTRKVTVANTKVGVGVQATAGGASGLTLLVPWRDKLYFQGTLGIAFFDGALSGTTDVIREFPEILSTQTSMTVYSGVGALVHTGRGYKSLISDTRGDMYMGVRTPVGISGTMNAFPVQLYLEVAPGILISPEFSVLLSAGLGFRWLF